MRTILSAFAILGLLAATPIAASAATTHKAAVHKPARSTKAAATRSRDPGNAAVDQLNDQSLARARGTTQ